MEESVDLHEEAGKENEQTVANLSPAEEATSKDEVEIEKFLQEQKSKNTQYKTKSDLNAWKKFCEGSIAFLHKPDRKTLYWYGYIAHIWNNFDCFPTFNLEF